ncbi:MAG: tRNA guanosine(15) transglycosylase TgtA [Candidatus Aenigmarchaeota archaeon]|nr:tRNA guanosine(15) transglycosylase TgtA [Candidatus Aenigmarchaeota archaeon]
MLEPVDRDAGGRICKWTVDKHIIHTPNIAIVINPNNMPVTPLELKKDFGAEIIITNSYIINKHEELKQQALKQGLHKFLNWSGPIYTDSGTFQMYSQGVKTIDPIGIVEFQKTIGSNIVTPVDVFTFPDDTAAVAKRKLNETVRRIMAARKSISDRYLVGPIQGGMYLDLRKAACKKVAKIQPDVFAIGGIVPLMESYRFDELAEIIITCKKNLPFTKPVHAFGAGHPMLFAFLTAIGCDLFDSAMYSLAAQRDGYLTTSGTIPLFDLQEFPCSCPVCSKADVIDIKKLPKPEREVFLAKHNLYVTFQEMRAIRTAIRGQWLWELVQERARAHPTLLEALHWTLARHAKWLLNLEWVSKRSALFWSGEESGHRPEILRALEWLKRVKSKRKFTKPPFGKIPVGLKSVYPFGQSIIPGVPEPKIKTTPKEIFSATVDYQFGNSTSKRFKDVRLEISRRTGRIRRVYKDNTLLGTIRPADGFFVPTIEGAKILKGKIKKVKITDPEVAGIVSRGGSVFVKFVKPLDVIFPGEEVSIVDKNNKIIGVGQTLLNSEEMKQLKRGVAIVRR